VLTTAERVAFLRTQSLLAPLAPDILEGLAGRCGEREFAAGEVLFEEGDPGDAIYFIVSGEVEVFTGDPERPIVLAVLEPPDLFGDMAVFDDGVRTTSARSRGPLTVLFLKDKAIRILIQKAPETAFGFFRILTHRLKRMNEHVAALSGGQPVRATLTIVEGPDHGRATPMAGHRIELGRRGGSPLEEAFRLSLSDSSADLARRHAEVFHHQGDFFLRDLGSKAGTTLNGARVTSTVDLQAGDIIGLGATRIRFEPAAR